MSEFYIVNAFDRPCERLIARKVTDEGTGYELLEYLHPNLRNHGRMAFDETEAVPVEDFGKGGCAAWMGLIDWVICGGESGPNARAMHPDWARELRDQCAAAGVPFFFKQWGEWVSAGCEAFGKIQPRAITWIRWDGSRWPHCPEDENADCVTLSCVGKKAAGRLLDGREHSEFPNAEVSHGGTPLAPLTGSHSESNDPRIK